MDVLAMHIRLYKTPTVNYVHITSAEINDFPGTSTRVPEDFFELETFGSLKTRYTRKKIFEERNFEIGITQQFASSKSYILHIRIIFISRCS